MIPESQQQIRNWLRHEFPECRDVEVSSMNDAARLLPSGAPLIPYVGGEAIALFRVVGHEPGPPGPELAVARPVLKGYSAEQILAALAREGIARRLRVSPEHRLYLDRRLQVEVLGTTWGETGRRAGAVRQR